MRYGSVCSGIEAATCAWHPLGWTPAWFCEIDPFPSAVLAHHYPSVPNHGDFTALLDPAHPVHHDPAGGIDVLVGGTPCQSFSIAGLRGGLSDARGCLMLDYLRLVGVLRPNWVVWENVPGVLSSGGGRDFGSFLGALGELGYGWAYRVLDAQYFGLAQRRKRVFVVGCSGGRSGRAASVLFEPEGLRGNPPASRAKGEGAAQDPGYGTPGGDGDGVTPFDTTPVTSKANRSSPQGGDPCHPLASGAHAPLVVSVPDIRGLDKSQNGSGWMEGDIAYTLDTLDTLDTLGAQGVAVAFKASHYTRGKDGAPSRVAPPLSADADKGDQDTLVFTGDGVVADPVCANEGRTYTAEGTNNFRMHNVVKPPAASVRRLTPRECERLQGFKDDFTLIPYRGKPAADGPRYKALGNSMAVPCMAFIGRRIALVEAADRPTWSGREEDDQE